MPPILYYVIPCYNDETVLPHTAPEIIRKSDGLIKRGAISDKSRIVLVNDGSGDNTWKVIKDLCENNGRIAGVDLSHNFGEQNALIAGLSVCGDADCVISMDSDLQDDIDLTDEMLDLFSKGYDVVLGVRTKRPEDSAAERFFSGSFYFLMKLFRTGLVRGHSNFRLLSKAAVKELLSTTGESYFLPARACSLGLPTVTAAYVRKARQNGVSGYSFKRKLRLGADSLILHSALFGPVRERSGAVKRNEVRFGISETVGFADD